MVPQVNTYDGPIKYVLSIYSRVPFLLQENLGDSLSKKTKLLYT